VVTAIELKRRDKQTYILPWLILGKISVIYPSLTLNDAQLLSTWDGSAVVRKQVPLIHWFSSAFVKKGITALRGTCSWLEFAMTAYIAFR